MSQQFCINGHDTFIVGRYKSGRCRACSDRDKWALHIKNGGPGDKAHTLATFRWRRKKMETLVGRECPELCELCGQPNNGNSSRLHADHSHISGVYRGWLCNNCNTGLGKFKEDPKLLTKAIEWVQNEGPSCLMSKLLENS